MNKNIITELQKVAMQQNWGGVERTNGIPRNVQTIYDAINTIEELQKEKDGLENKLERYNFAKDSEYKVENNKIIRHYILGNGTKELSLQDIADYMNAMAEEYSQGVFYRDIISERMHIIAINELERLKTMADSLYYGKDRLLSAEDSIEDFKEIINNRISYIKQNIENYNNDNCITPPVKLGTKIYKIVYNANIDKKEIYDYILDYCDNEKYYTDNDYLIHEFRTHYFKDFNKTWFLTKEEAEKKLKEKK